MECSPFRLRSATRAVATVCLSYGKGRAAAPPMPRPNRNALTDARLGRSQRVPEYIGIVTDFLGTMERSPYLPPFLHMLVTRVEGARHYDNGQAGVDALDSPRCANPLCLGGPCADKRRLVAAARGQSHCTLATFRYVVSREGRRLPSAHLGHGRDEVPAPFPTASWSRQIPCLGQWNTRNPSVRLTPKGRAKVVRRPCPRQIHHKPLFGVLGADTLHFAAEVSHAPPE
jgi:hypothetical protein